ncbi:MAG: DUF3990 domain-containing protein [Succinivibrio sp.]|nr:DUF3990 domain-containing protein [Succinivibrio sp.]
MRLYHGSNIPIREINLAMCRPYKDFGRGFYLTQLVEQARSMARRKARIFGGSAVVSEFELSDDFAGRSELRILNFGSETSESWARFVRNNRNRNLTDFANPDCNLDHKYDIVIGPVADDNMNLLFQQYEKGLLNFADMCRAMAYRQVSNQYSFHTERSVSLLKWVRQL